MRVVVPFDADTPKTRLGNVFDAEERATFATLMLQDVLTSLETVGIEPEVLATGPVSVDVPVRIDERPLTKAVNSILESTDRSVAIVMADLPLATPNTFERLFETAGQIVLVPGIGGGTNAIIARHPEFRVDYHGLSIRDHRERAHALDIEPTEVDSARLSTDIDERGDLPEMLLRGEGRATDWLGDRFELVITDGRVDISRRSG